MASLAVAASVVCIFRFVVGTAFFALCFLLAVGRNVTVPVAVIALPDLQLWCIHFRVVVFRVDEESELDASVSGISRK
jgi:hypothetical protein